MDTAIRVLHVDDEPDIADLVATFLKEVNNRFEVETADNVKEGLDSLAQGQFDCIISDYDMPGQDGIEFLEAVREENPELPFILYTGKGSEEVASEAISAEVTDYLQKQPDTDHYELLANRILNAVDQHQSKQRNANLERIRRVSKNINKALVHSKSRSDIEHQICQIISDAEPYLFAWIGKSDSETHDITSSTSVGTEEGYLDIIELTTTDQPSGQGPTGKAFRNREMVVAQNIPENAEYEPWRADALERGYESSAAIPLLHNDTLYGVLNVYADRTQAFDEEEKELLQEIAEDAAHALHHIESRERLQAYGRLVENLPVGVYRATSGPEGEVIDVNPALEDLMNADSPDQLKGRTVSTFYQNPSERAALSTEIQETGLVNGKELKMETIDGEEIWISVTAIPTEENGETYFDGVIQDVTERKERERDLRLFREAVKASGHSIYFTDPEGRIEYANPSFEEITGYSAEEVRGRNPRILKSGEHDQDFYQELWETVLAGDVWRDQLVNSTKSGDRYIVDQTIAPITGASGEIEHLVAVNADMTAQEEQKQELRQTQAFIEDSLNALDDVFFVINEEMELIRWNNRVSEVTGYSDVELDDMLVTAFFSEEHHDRILTNIEDILETGSATVKANLLTDYGTLIPFELRGTRLMDPKSDGVVIAGIGRDITERKEHEQELERYETIVEASGDPVYTLDEEGCFTFLNEAALEITGYSEEELLGEPVETVVAPENVDPAEKLVRSLLTEGKQHGTFEIDVQTKTGEVIPAENRLSLLYSDEELQGSVGVVRNISDRLERERKLQRERDRLDRFAGVVSHDLRNPLNVASGRLELAKEDCESEHLDSVAKALGRMDTLIDDVLTLARAGKTVGRLETVQLADLIDACWRNVETESRQLHSVTTAIIRGDETRLQQLFENLFRNAVEHGGADVTIQVGDLPDGFYVEDDGPGITDAERDQVLEPGHSTSEEGTGFGLSIVRDIAAAHDWEMDITTGEDGGARFEITGVEFAA